MNGDVMLREIKEQSKKIKECDIFNADKIKELTGLIEELSPSNIVIVARGTSLHVGYYAKYMFEMYTHIPVSIASQSIFTVYDIEVDYSNSVVIAISQSGKGIDILEVVKKANKQGAMTIGIINELESVIAKEVDHILYCHAGYASPSMAATKTYITSLYLIHQLVYVLSKDDTIKISCGEVCDAIEQGLRKRDEIKILANNFKDYRELICLSRGKYLTLALELALKMKESCLMNANEYPMSEFLHGPIASINDHTPIVFFDVDRYVRNNTIEIVEKLKDIDVDTLIITNDKDMVNKTKHSIYIDGNDIEALFVAVVILQLFTYESAMLRGTNPDFIESCENVKTF